MTTLARRSDHAWLEAVVNDAHCSGPQDVWAALAKLAKDTVDAYHQDLYWDAQWITNHWKMLSHAREDFRPVEFFFSVRPTGTEIGFEERYVNNAYAEAAYRISFTWNQHKTRMGMWIDRITEKPKEGCL